MTEPDYLADDYDDDRDIDILRDKEGRSVHVAFDDVDELLLTNMIKLFKDDRQGRRRAAKYARDREARHKSKIWRAASLLQFDDVWYTSQNERMLISEMTPRHASRSLNLVLNDFERWAGTEVEYSDLGLSFELKDAPLVKALTKRSKAKETKRHRRMDQVTDAVYRAAASGQRVNIWETIQEFDRIDGTKW